MAPAAPLALAALTTRSDPTDSHVGHCCPRAVAMALAMDVAASLFFVHRSIAIREHLCPLYSAPLEVIQQL